MRRVKFGAPSFWRPGAADREAEIGGDFPFAEMSGIIVSAMSGFRPMKMMSD